MVRGHSTPHQGSVTLLPPYQAHPSTLHKPCLLGLPSSQFQPALYHLYLVWTFIQHTAAVHRQWYTGKYLTTSSQGKAMICSISQFSWCKYCHHSQFQGTNMKSLIMEGERYTVGSGEPEGACSSAVHASHWALCFWGKGLCLTLCITVPSTQKVLNYVEDLWNKTFLPCLITVRQIYSNSHHSKSLAQTFSYNTRKSQRSLALYRQASTYLRAQILELDCLESNPGFST